MGGTVPERDESLAWQLGCCIPNLQVFQRRQDGILHDKCNRIAQFLLPPSKPPEERVSEFAGVIKSPVSGNIWNREKMDSPDPELGKNPGRAGSHVLRQDAGVTKNAGMPRVNTRSRIIRALITCHPIGFLLCTQISKIPGFSYVEYHFPVLFVFLYFAAVIMVYNLVSIYQKKSLYQQSIIDRIRKTD